MGDRLEYFGVIILQLTSKPCSKYRFTLSSLSSLISLIRSWADWKQISKNLSWTYVFVAPLFQVLTLFVLFNNFFTNFTLSGVAEALNRVRNGLASWNCFFAVGTFHIVLALLVLGSVLTNAIIVVGTATFHRHELPLSAKNFGVAFTLDIQHLHVIFGAFSDPTPPLWFIALFWRERMQRLRLRAITYKCCLGRRPFTVFHALMFADFPNPSDAQ